MSITAPIASILVAVISAVISIFSLKQGRANQVHLEEVRGETSRRIEDHKSQLTRDEDDARRDRDARDLVKHFRDPLLRTANDFQSRLYNILGPNKFRGSSDDGDYFRLNTLFVFADFLGWLEIVRRDMQFLDLGDVQATHELNKQIVTIQDSLASTTRMWDPNYLYRGQQRAIGEIMTIAIENAGTRTGPRYETIGFAAFCKKMQDPEFARWFDRLGGQLPSLPDHGSERLAEVQRGLVDLIKVLDPDSLRYNIRLEKL